MYSLQTSLFQSIINQIAEPALVVLANTPHYTILASNESHRIITNKVGQHVLGQHLMTVFSPEEMGFSDFSLLIAGMAQCIQTKQEVTLFPAGLARTDQLAQSSIKILQKSDQAQIVSWKLQIRPLLSASGLVEYLIGTRIRIEVLPSLEIGFNENCSEDLSAARCMNLQLSVANSQLEAYNKKLNSSNYALRALNADLQRLHFSNHEPGVKSPDLDALKMQNYLFAQAEAEVSRDKINKFYMQAPAGICILDGPDLVFELVNPLYQSIFPSRILLGKSALIAMPELLNNPIWQIMKQVFLTGISFEGKELQIPLARIPGGPVENRYFNVIYQARRNDLNEIDGLIIFSFEVTDLVLVKRELEHSEKRFRVILDALPQIAWTSNVDGDISFVNQRWYDFTGLDFEKNKHNLWALTLHEDDLGPVSKQVELFMSQVKAGEVEFRKKRHDGIYRWHLARMQPVLNADGKLLFWIGTATDIEDLKWLQQQKDDFVNIASHELKTPLTSLQISIQLLEQRMKVLSPELINVLVCRAAQNMNKVVNLVEDLLNAGKLSQGQLEMDKSWFLPVNLVQNYCQDLNMVGNYQVVFSGDTDRRIFGDAKRIEQVFINIFNNAIKYAADSKIITVFISQVEGYVKIDIADKGPGISAELIPRLFDRYYHVENRGFQNTGLGLGLYICAEIVKKHGGHIEVASKVGSGSTFSFTIPEH